MIELKNLSKTYVSPDEEINALQDVSIRVESGQVYGIVGYSGAGKSTLVRCINYLEKPDAGSITIDGIGSITVKNGVSFYRAEGSETEVRLTERHLKALRNNLGMIFQHFNLLDRSTVFDNIAYPLKYTGRDRENIRKRVLELLELVDLTDKVNAYPSELSGGQKQRVAIARALANNPRILLCGRRERLRRVFQSAAGDHPEVRQHLLGPGQNQRAHQAGSGYGQQRRYPHQVRVCRTERRRASGFGCVKAF